MESELKDEGMATTSLLCLPALQTVVQGEGLFSRACCDSTRDNSLKLKGSRFGLGIGKKFFIMSETLEQVAPRGGRRPIPGNIQVGQGSGQPDLVEDVPAHGSRVGLDGL